MHGQGEVDNGAMPTQQPEWARAHEVLNAMRDDLSRRVDVLQAEVNSKIEEIDHYRQVMARIDGGPPPIALNKAYETTGAASIRRW